MEGHSSASQLSNHNSGQIQSTDFRKGLLGELQDTVIYDSPAVEEMIFVPRLHSGPAGSNNLTCDTGLMNTFVKRIKKDCQRDFEKVQDLAERATPKGLDPAQKRELLLYKPLSNILQRVEELCVESSQAIGRPYYRKLICNSEKALKTEDTSSADDFSIKPDFPLVEVRRSEGTLAIEHAPRPDEDIYWRRCPAFLEVKAADAPFPRRGDNVKQTLAQGADYARAILSSRPFQMYVFGIFLWKTQFCLAYFDRRGVVLSPEFNLFRDDGLRKFIIAVIRFTWEMSPEDLGHDPSVTLTEGTAYYDNKYPRFEVTMGQEQDSRRCLTFGPPLYSSHSLLGRGTSVWQVVYVLPRSVAPAILKCAWRSSNRPSEIENYDKIEVAFNGKVSDGIAEPITGGDVFLRYVHEPITIALLRKPLDPEDTRQRVGDIRLHRIILNDFGKPLIKFRDMRQLGEVFTIVLKAHKALASVGILHRDISPSNILIRVNARFLEDRNELVVEEYPEQNEGFLTDFELASFPRPQAQLKISRKAVRKPNRDRLVRKPTTLNASTSTGHIRFGDVVEHPVPPKVVAPGDEITGTATFMATVLLKAVAEHVSIRRSAEHDLESFCWVMLYVVYVRARSDARDRQWAKVAELESEFVELFSAFDAGTLVKNRTNRLNPMVHQDWFTGIAALLAYYKETDTTTATSGFLQVLWVNIKNMQPKGATTHSEQNHYLAYFLSTQSSLEQRPEAKRPRLDNEPRKTHNITHDDVVKFLQILTGDLDDVVLAGVAEKALGDDGKDESDDEAEYDEEGGTDEEEAMDDD